MSEITSAVRLDTRTKNCRRLQPVSRGETLSPWSARVPERGFWKIQEIDDAHGCVGKERRGEAGGAQQRLDEVAEDRSHARHLRRLLGERERRGLDDVLVGAIAGAQQRLEGAIEAEIHHMLVDFALGGVEHLCELAVDRLERSRRGKLA